jgi:tetratricopeptide (TPR) repeat protein
MLRLPFALTATAIVAVVIVFTCGQDLPSAQAKVRTKGKNTVSPSEENYDIATSKYKAGDLEGAVDAYLQAIYFSRNYYNPDAYYWLGVCYMERKQDAKAIEAFKKNVEQAMGEVPESHLHLSELYLRNDRINEAEGEALTALTQFHGKGARAHNMLGLINVKRGSYDNAQLQFQLALGDGPWRYTEAWMNLAENYMRQKAWADALKQFNDMLTTSVELKGLDREKVLVDMGLCLLAKGDHQGAIDHWHECLNYNQGNAAAHLQLAMIFDLEQHFNSAIKEYREYLRFSNDQAAVSRVKARVTALEQKVGPAEIEPQAPKPSPYMRQQMEEQDKQESNKKETLTAPGGNKESGF